MLRRILFLCAAISWAAACTDTTQQGFVVPTDAYGKLDGAVAGFGKDSGAGGGDSGNQQAGETVGSGSETAVATDAGSQSLLVYAQGKDDFGGVCDSLCALLMTQNNLRKIGVRYTKDGKPVEGLPVEFAPLDPAKPLLEILTPNVVTDEKGEAWADIKSGMAVGKDAVLARVPDDPDAGQLQFDITVQTKAKGPMTVTLHYVGSKLLTDFGSLQARLIKQTAGQPACSTLDLGDTLPPAAWTSPNLQWDKPWALTFPSLPQWIGQQNSPDGTVTFTVVGIAHPAAGSNTTKALAAGCVDTGAVLKVSEQGVAIGDDVIVAVKDIPPRLKGIYDLTSHIDLLSILPDPVEMVLKTVLDVVTDPIAGLLGLACKLGGNTLNSLCGYVFDDPKNPSIKDLTAVGNIVTKFLDAILYGFLPDNVKTALNTGADLNEILTNLEVGGTIEIKQEPDATGFVPAAQTKEVWSTVTYKWTLGQTCNPKDPNCGKKTFNVEAFQSDAIVGQFDLWRDEILSQIKIGKHALKVKWGAMLNYIVQKQLLPLITADPKNPNAPVIDSYSKLVKSLLAGKQCLVKDTCCDDFGKQLAGKQSLMSASFLGQTCEVLVTLGTGYLESLLNGLDGTTGDPAKGSGLLLSADKCPIFETNQDQLIDLIGGALPKDQCHWDMTLTIGGKPNQIKGIFTAVRQQ